MALLGAGIAPGARPVGSPAVGGLVVEDGRADLLEVAAPALVVGSQDAPLQAGLAERLHDPAHESCVDAVE